MAKGANNISKKRSVSSKPYDVSNSFVKQVAGRVSNLLPQTSWLNRWLVPTTPSDEDTNFLSNQVISEDDNLSTGQPPPTKRPRIPLHQSFSADNFLISKPSIRNESVGANSKANLSCYEDDQEEAGPSGLSSLPQSRLVSSTPATPLTHTAQLTSMANGDDQSDSGESTSGCSSLVPQGTRQSFNNETIDNSTAMKRASVDERDFSTYLQSSRIFPNRTTPSLCLNSSNSRQGPSFNASLYTLPFSTRSPSIDKSFSSPFYPGPTTYGGASATRKPRNGFFSPSEILPATQSIQVKPVNRSDSSELSSVTARRILDTLDELSSPVRDAKRVPLMTPTTRKRRAETTTPGSPGPPTRDLPIPTVPDLLKLHRRMKLQDSLESARLIASTSTGAQTPISSEYRLRLQQEANRHTGKITSRTKESDEDFHQDIHLPSIALPITSLPKFDFMLPVATKQGFVLGKASDVSLLRNKLSPPLAPIAKFKSSTSSEKRSTLTNVPGTQIPVANSINFIPSCPSKVNAPFPQTRLKEKSKKLESAEGNGPVESSGFGVGVAGELKTGSVMDILGKSDSTFNIKPLPQPFGSTLKPGPGSWECNTCLVRNKVDVSQCMSCKTPQSLAKPPISSTKTLTTPSQSVVTTSKPPVSSGFGSQFHLPIGTWVCASCMVQNKPEASSCIACTTAKSGSKSTHEVKPSPVGFDKKFLPAGDTWECITCMVRNKASLEYCAACESKKPGSANNLPVAKPTSGFGNMFKKPEGSWECPDCLVVNKAVLKCVACGASKPGTAKATNVVSVPPSSTSGFGDMFKLPEGSWECPDCMLVNKDVWKCVACEATKPGIPGFGDMFKPPEGSWECPVCMVSNKNTSKCVACEAPKPGSGKAVHPIPTIKFNFEIPPEANSFKFGVDKANDSTSTVDTTTASKPATASFKFGAPTTMAETGFTFGKPITKTSTSNAPTGFSFGNGISVGKTTPKPETTSSPLALFTFGIPPSEKEKQQKENEKDVSSVAEPNSTESKESIDSMQANKVTVQAPFSFGSIKPNETAKLKEIAPSVTFGTPTSTSSLVGASSVKLNGPSAVTSAIVTSTTSNAINSTPSFGSVTSSTAVTTISSQPVFGTSKPSPVFGGFSTNAIPSFGQPSTTTSPSTTTFGAQAKSTSFNFVAPTAVGQKRSCTDDEDRIPGGKKQAAGFTSLTGATSGNYFGSSAITSTTISSASAPVLSFGSSTKTLETSFKSPVTPSFGNTFSSKSTDSVSDKPASSTPFVFGASAGGAAPPAYSFSTKQENSVSAPSSTFNFVAAPPVSGGGFTFSTQSSEKPAGGFSFASTPASFGNVSTVAPVFGSAPAAQPPAYPAPGTGFNFGGSSQQVPTTSVFSFSAAAPPVFAFGHGATPAPTFDPNARPSFNFTGGEIPQFTAAGATVQPSPGARRIKKAVRRTPR